MNDEIKMDAFAVWNYLSAMYENDPSVDLKKALDASWRVYSGLEKQA